MGLLHEFMKMHPPFRRRRDRFEKQIHQPRFAAADIAVDIEAGGRRRGPRPATEPAPPARRRLIPLEARGEVVQTRGDRVLGRVGRQGAVIDQRVITGENAGFGGHRRLTDRHSRR